MSDLTVHAESLIATVARAFYDDDAVCVIDVLLRDKFLRDDDMGPRLSLPAKQLRRTLQFLQEEHFVRFELVDDLSSGGSQATKFWYIDYNHAVNTIRLRIYLLRKKLEEAEMRARSNSFYLCPGYKVKRCNGRYTEEQAQQVLDRNSGMFLCQECVRANEANPNPPEMCTYTLNLVDNSRALRQAMDDMRHINVQLSRKVIGNQQLRPGIYDLLQKVRGVGKGPLTSNLPSENFALGIGSKRLAGTGRTAGIKAKKLAQQGVAPINSVDQLLGGKKGMNDGDWTFLKNAMGQELALEVEKGGGARANLLATMRRRRRKLLDTAASRIGVQVPIYWKMKEKKKREAEERKKAKNKRHKGIEQLEFLNNNIGRNEEEDKRERVHEEAGDDYDDDSDANDERYGISLVDESDEWHSKSEEDRRAFFQAQYKIEVGRQVELLQAVMGKGGNNVTLHPSIIANNSGVEDDDTNVTWEDG